MNQRLLGHTGISVSEISFGGVEIGIPYGIGVNSVEDMPTDSQSIDLLHAAIDKGINFFDTARAYGRSEEIMGKAFKGKRDQVVICTKCSHLSSDEEKLADKQYVTETINSSIQQSLSELQTDYIDVYKLHNAHPNILKNETVLDTFAKLKKEGLVRAAGVSTYAVQETQLAIEQGVWDVVQLSFNLLDQRQLALFDMAQKAGIGIVIRSVLLKGILSDKGRNLHPALKTVQEYRERYQSLLDDNVSSLSVLATKFALSFSQVSSVLVGIDRMEYLEKAVETADGHYLNSDVLQKLKNLAYPDPAFLDLPKWDREGWLK